MKKANWNLHKAKAAKNDEFYTQLNDIESEMKHYKDHFKWKIIYCNCDDPEWSNFYKYFSINFNHLWLKKLITTHFEKEEWKESYKLELNEFWKEPIKTLLNWNWDFRSDECIELLKESDIIITNPPFSLFREYLKQLDEYNKKFIIIWNMNAITYKEIFKLIKENKMWIWNWFNLSMVYKSPYKNELEANKNFVKQKWYDPDSHIKVPAVVWYTNLEHKKRNEELILYKSYEEDKEYYPKYDNYNAINIDKVKEIPKDYDWYIWVPITFLWSYNPKQFEIIKFRKWNDEKDLVINWKSPYFRIIIKKII